VKISYRNKAKIIENDEIKYVEKNKKKDVNEILKYLDIRGFNNYAKVIEEEKDKVRYEFIDNIYTPPHEMGQTLIRTVADLHYKTTYYKDVSRKKYKDIYTKLVNNIDYLKEYYENLANNFEKSEYMSPSEYYFMRNYTIIISSLLYSERELNKWFKMVEKKETERVSVVHNNLRTEHFIMGDKGYLINWDYSIVDTPVLDLYKFYKKELNNYEFKSLLKTYNENFSLNDEEKKLFLILIIIPDKIEISKNELDNVINFKRLINYLIKTNNLVQSDIFKTV